MYPRLFGNSSRGIFTLEADMFKQTFGLHEIDPRWLCLGVFEFAPTPSRNSWLYVTSGASTPWETAPEEYSSNEFSGLGVELVLEVPQQADWAINTLRRLLAYHLLTCLRYLDQNPPMDYGHRIPAGGPINADARSKLTIFAIAKPTHYADSAQLDSGRFHFLHVVGITERERDYAKRHCTADLIAKLESNGAYPVTNAARTSIRLWIPNMLAALLRSR